MKPKKDKQRVFEVVGIHHENHGAVLMLEAIRAAIGEHDPSAIIALPHAAPAEFRRQYSAIAARPSEIWGRKDALLARLPAPAMGLIGLVSPNTLAARLDASGFAYGDYWGLGKLVARLVRPLRAFPRRPTILMPQAFGPFREPGMAAAIREAMDRVDLAFVRDRRSLDYLHEAGVREDRRIRLMPDFTNLLIAPQSEISGKNRILIIPNQKIVDGASGLDRQNYGQFLADAASSARRAGYIPAFLIHEGERDRALAEEANASLSSPCEIFMGQSPIQTKAMIGASAGVVSSRFHGLVSALSSGVPALAAGWSHKYEELMSSYDAGDWTINIREPGEIRAKLDGFFSSIRDPDAKVRLSAAAKTQREEVKGMWRTIFALIDRDG